MEYPLASILHPGAPDLPRNIAILVAIFGLSLCTYFLKRFYEDREPFRTHRFGFLISVLAFFAGIWLALENPLSPLVNARELATSLTAKLSQSPLGVGPILVEVYKSDGGGFFDQDQHLSAKASTGHIEDDRVKEVIKSIMHEAAPWLSEDRITVVPDLAKQYQDALARDGLKESLIEVPAPRKGKPIVKISLSAPVSPDQSQRVRELIRSITPSVAPSEISVTAGDNAQSLWVLLGSFTGDDGSFVLTPKNPADWPAGTDAATGSIALQKAFVGRQLALREVAACPGSDIPKLGGKGCVARQVDGVGTVSEIQPVGFRGGEIWARVERKN